LNCEQFYLIFTATSYSCIDFINIRIIAISDYNCN